MNKTKTEDLVNFEKNPDAENINFCVVFYKDGARLIFKSIKAKTRLALEKKIRSFIDVQWPAEKDKISYRIK